MSAARRAAVLPAVLATYYATVVPAVRRELRRWERTVEAIPDAELRRHAQVALVEKSLNPEAVAVFAVLAPRRHRGTVVRAIVALQVAIDYLDLLGEQDTSDPLADGLQLHRALPTAVTPGAPVEDWYRLHPREEDGGYLSELVHACQDSLARLPAAAQVQAETVAAARRCGEGQSHTHAASRGGVAALERWAAGLDAPEGYLWWEAAAGASSSVAAHALIAAASDTRTNAARARRLDSAYFPSVGALTVLLDDLIDRDRDAATRDHSYVGYYSNAEAAGERLALIASQASSAVGSLPHAGRHDAILAGVVGFYLSAEEARAPHALPVRERLLASCGPGVRSIAAALRLRRRRSGGNDAPGPST